MEDEDVVLKTRNSKRSWVLGINGTENPRNDAVTKPRNGESIPWAMTRRISGCQSRKITSIPARADKTASAVSSRTYKSAEFLRQLSVPSVPNTQVGGILFHIP